MSSTVIQETFLIFSVLQLIARVSCIQCSYYDAAGLKHLFSCSTMEYCCASKCCKSFGEFMQYWHFWVCMLLIVLLCTCGGCWYARHYYHMKALYTDALSTPTPQTSNRWRPRRPFITTWGVLLPSVRNILRQQQRQQQQQQQQLIAGCVRRESSIMRRQPQPHPQESTGAASLLEDVNKSRPVGGLLADTPPPTYVETLPPSDTVSLPPSYSSTLVHQI